MFREVGNAADRQVLAVPRPAPCVQNEQSASWRCIHLQVEIILVAVRRRDACRAAWVRKRIQIQLLAHVRRRAASVVGAHAVARLVKQHTVDHREALCAPRLHAAHRVLLNPVCAARGHIHLVHPVFLEKQRVALIIHGTRPAAVRPDRRSVTVRAHACIFAPHVEAPKRARVDPVDELPVHRAVLAAPEAVLRLDDVVHIRDVHRRLDIPYCRRRVVHNSMRFRGRVSVQNDVVFSGDEHLAVYAVRRVVSDIQAGVRAGVNAGYPDTVSGSKSASDAFAFQPHHRHILRAPVFRNVVIYVGRPCLAVDVCIAIFGLFRLHEVQIVVFDSVDNHDVFLAIVRACRVYDFPVPAARANIPQYINVVDLLPIRP